MPPATATAQLSLDGADRLHALLRERVRPVDVHEAARCLFALRSAPVALVRRLVDEVVRGDPRFVWRSSSELALTEWEEVASLTDLALEDAPYVVFDLETTGTRPGVARIVELGAVRMHGFEVAGELERLVDPGTPIPFEITRLTGIAARDVRGRPRVGPVLDEFLSFAQGAVLVAHNARFDVGFVDAELSRMHGRRLAAPVLDTVMLARRLLAGRLSNMSLGTLAERFDTQVRPCHRALADASATAEVLVHLLGMSQERGVRTVGQAIAFSGPAQRRSRGRRELASGIPRGPGVYLFRGGDDHVLYVGKASDLRARVRSYFAGGSLPRPVEHALEATERIETRPLGSELEAALLELELIARLRPPGNRRGVHPERACFLTLTVNEPVPRLSVTAQAVPGAISAGPLRSRGQAGAAAAALRAAFGLRTCRPARPEDDGSCLAGLVGACVAPCRGGDRVDRHAEAVAGAGRWLAGDPQDSPLRALRARMCALRDQLRYEEAASVRDQLDALDATRRALDRLRRARRHRGVLLAADLDPRFVQAFACAGGRVVARRRLPRAGDAALEIAPLLRALAAAAADEDPLEPGEADAAGVLAAAFVRPGRVLRAVPGADAPGIARARRSVPLRG
ncbi:MAG: exonuclease domain-containing protein [Gaiellales bacterium]